MPIKNTYVLTEGELCHMIKEVAASVITENDNNEGFTYNDMFGLKTNRQNRINAITYAKYYGTYVKKIQAIANEIDRRINVLTNASNGQVSESIGAFSKIGSRLASKGITKAAARGFAKKAGKVVGAAGLASIPAFIIGPQNIQAFFQKFNTNRGQVTPKEVIGAYDELASWMQNICSALQEHPEILGATQLDASVLNGPEGVDNGPMFTAGDAIEMAAGIGVYAIPYIGWALGAIDLAHSIVHAGADANREGLEMVKNQMKYLDKAIANVNAALSGKNPNTQKQQTQQPAGQQQQTATPQLPNGYVVGQPAPFAGSDPAQVQRLQNYLGLQATGKWDRNTQSAWDKWLQETYGTNQSVGRTAKNVGKNVGRALVSR